MAETRQLRDLTAQGAPIGGRAAARIAAAVGGRRTSADGYSPDNKWSKPPDAGLCVRFFTIGRPIIYFDQGTGLETVGASPGFFFGAVVEPAGPEAAWE